MSTLAGTLVRLWFLAMVALIALVPGGEAGAFPAPDGNCSSAEQEAGLCTILAGFVVEPHALYPQIDDAGNKLYKVRVTPTSACTQAAKQFTMTFESPGVPGSCRPLPQASMFGCSPGGCTVDITTNLAGENGTGNMGINLRTIDLVRFNKTLACNAGSVDLTLAFQSTDTINRALGVNFSDFAVKTNTPLFIGMIPGPFCVPPKPEQSIISTKYTIEGHGEFTVILDNTGGVVEVLDVNGNPAPVIPLTDTFTCTPAAGRCPTSDLASFCTTATGPELLCEQNVAALGEVVLKTGEESSCYKLIGGAMRRVC